MARDYASSRAPRKKKGKAQSKSSSGMYIRVVAILVVVLTAFATMLYFKFNAKPVQKVQQSASSTPSNKKDVVDERPKKDEYKYRHLLENSEVKTDNNELKRRNEQSYASTKRPDVIIDPNKKKESRDQEAARAQAILNGSLNTPRGDITHTVKIQANDKIVVLDEKNNQIASSHHSVSSDAKLSSAQIEARENTSEGDSTKSVSSDSVLQTRNSQASSKETDNNKASSKVADNKSNNKNTASKADSNSSQADGKQAKANTANYFMQCGAFKKEQQAESLRKQISAKGYQVRISRVDVKSVTWYRVIVGPYATNNMVKDARVKIKSQKLANNCNIYKR